jgi:hypothetical protein
MSAAGSTPWRPRTPASANVGRALCVALLVWQFARLDPMVEARGFVLRDAHGRARAELMIHADGSPILRLNNRYGCARAMLPLRDDGAVALRLMDPAGTNRAELSLDRRGEPALVLSGANGRSRVILAAGEAGEQSVALRDRFGRPIWSSPAPATPGDQAARSR